jgi:peptidoglycan/LPS O-acetylase OafA/YrhL
LPNSMPSKPNSSKEFAGLEIARFLCALAVIFWHYQHFFVKGIYAGVGQAGKFPLYHLFGFFYDNGYLAVQIFWMISGLIFFWKYSTSINSGEISAYRFFVLRFSRLYPLHFATLIVVALLQMIYIWTHGTSFVYRNNDAFHFTLQLAFASNWIDELPMTFNGPIWSISVEVLIYAFFFVVASFLRPGLKLCLILCIVVTVAGRATGQIYTQNVFQCVEFFFAGGAMQAISASLSRRHKLVGFGVCVLGLCLSVATNFRFGSIIGFSFFVVAAFALLDEVVSLRRSALTNIGDLTYASYLLHFPIQLASVLVVDALGLSRDLFLAPGALAAFILGTFGSAWIVFRIFEMPAQDALRAAWLRRRERVAVATA